MTDARPDRDLEAQIADRLRQAHADRHAVYINGGGSKRHFLGRDCDAATLEVGGHSGIVDYQPRELVVTARAGTTISALQATLAQEGQHLSFEPPQFAGLATLGGTLASNLSGPGRPWWGSARDMVLGARIISGTGEPLNFGGQVMKNVAGYDVSRLQAGALGSLGVLSSISLKVLPLPEASTTLVYECDAATALQMMHERAASPKPLTGACWVAGRLYLRLSGAASAVAHTASLWGGERPEQGPFWADLRDMRLPFFATEAPLWRLSLRSSAPPQAVADEDLLIDWGGAQRWIRGEHSLASLHEQAAGAGGHVQLVRGGDRSAELRGPLQGAQQHLQQQLKSRFDPGGILNPGRMYTWL